MNDPDQPHENSGNSRSRHLETLLINAGKFGSGESQHTLSSLVERIREQTKILNETCDEMEKAIAASEQSAREAGDSLINMLKRIK